MSIEKVKSKCCGCRTCITVCPFNAISVAVDRYGFEQMYVNYDTCRECGKCESVCPALHVYTGQEHFSSGVAFALNDEDRRNGSSGGLFGIFAKKTIADGGAVFGAAFDRKLKLKTTSAETFDELTPLYKSKYLLCDTNNKFPTIRDELKRGRKVLYCSSPCQISALKLFLGQEYENLLTVDFVCHGVGSQTLFDESIRYSEQKMGAIINNVVFRYKAQGASSHYYYYYYEKKQKHLSKSDLYLSFPYYNAYCKQLVCRESCYSCQYATEGRASDITIGDFHTIEKYDRTIDRFAGVSMFAVNTRKGEQFFSSVQQELSIRLFEWEAIKKNNRFNGGDGIPDIRQDFMESVANQPFGKTVSRFLKPMKDWKRLFYYKSPSFLRNFVRNRLGE